MDVHVRQIPVFVFPTNLKFYLGSRQSHKQVLTIYNPYEFKVRYKVLCTTPNKYTVIDPEGSIAPQSCIDLVVRHTMPVSANCNIVDKFRVSISDHVTKQESVLVMKDLYAELCSMEDARSECVLIKFESVLDEKLDFALALSCFKDYFKYANITSLDVKRSFSLYKHIFSSRRTRLPEITLEMLLMLLPYFIALLLILKSRKTLKTFLGKRDVESRLLPGEPDTSSNDGDNFQTLPHSDMHYDDQSSQIPIAHFQRVIKHSEKTNYFAIVIAIVCIIVLMLPTKLEPQEESFIPTYLYPSVTLKLGVAYVLGMLTTIIFRQ